MEGMMRTVKAYGEFICETSFFGIPEGLPTAVSERLGEACRYLLSTLTHEVLALYGIDDRERGKREVGDEDRKEVPTRRKTTNSRPQSRAERREGKNDFATQGTERVKTGRTHHSYVEPNDSDTSAEERRKGRPRGAEREGKTEREAGAEPVIHRSKGEESRAYEKSSLHFSAGRREKKENGAVGEHMAEGRRDTERRAAAHGDRREKGGISRAKKENAVLLVPHENARGRRRVSVSLSCQVREKTGWRYDEETRIWLSCLTAGIRIGGQMETRLYYIAQAESGQDIPARYLCRPGECRHLLKGKKRGEKKGKGDREAQEQASRHDSLDDQEGPDISEDREQRLLHALFLHALCGGPAKTGMKRQE